MTQLSSQHSQGNKFRASLGSVRTCLKKTQMGGWRCSKARALASLPKHMGLNPSTHMAPHNQSQDPAALFRRAVSGIRHTRGACSDRIPMCIIFLTIKLKIPSLGLGVMLLACHPGHPEAEAGGSKFKTYLGTSVKTPDSK